MFKLYKNTFFTAIYVMCDCYDEIFVVFPQRKTENESSAENVEIRIQK